jgi:fibronectin-binding autotransporter adhesin
MKMTSTQQRMFAAAIAVAVWGAASSAQAQTIVNLTNLDPTAITGYGQNLNAAGTTSTTNAATNLDLLNSTTALTNGGLFPGAVSNQSQAAYNQLNTIGINANGTVSPVVLGNQTPVAGSPNQVQINTITSAYNGAFGGAGTGTNNIQGASSTTINNINAAISSAVNPIVGGLNNNPWIGGYGGAASGASVTANQVGVNTINGVGATFADGTNIALSQLPGAPDPATPVAGSPVGTLPVIQGGSLNMSTTNTLLAYSTAGTVGINGNNGVDSKGDAVRGNQSAVNTFNASTLVGTNLSVGAQQLADGLNAYQSGVASINRALAYSPGNQAANIDPSVTNLNQTASVGMNALNLQQSGTTATSTTLSGLQTVGYNTVTTTPVVGGAPDATLTNTGVTAGTVPVSVSTNQIVASTVSTGGFMPTSFGTTALVVGTGAGQVTQAVYDAAVAANAAARTVAAWDGLAGTTASGMPMPGSTAISGVSAQNGSAFLPGSFNPNAVVGSVNGTAGLASNPYTALNAGTVNVANAAQAVNLTNNTVSAGSAANPMNVTFGPAGFEQRTGTVGIASNTSGSQTSGLTTGLGSSVTSPGGLSNAQALTGVGSSSISALAQSFQTANNTFQGSGDVNGTLTQASSGVRFNAAEIVSGNSGTTGIQGLNGGSGLSNGAGNTAYALDTATSNGSALNNAVAGAVYGPSSLTNVGQTGTTYANIAAATGTIDTAASGTLAQSLGAITNYTGVQNSAVASTVASGNVAATNTNQSLNVTGNAVQAALVNGSIAQVAEGSGTIATTGSGAAPVAYGATNAVLASAGNGSTIGQGSAALSGTTQTNTTTLNAIQSAGALGSSTVPAAFAQQNGTVGTQLGATPTGPTSGVWSATSGGVNTAMIAPSNLAVAQTANGAGGSATANNTTQVARLSVNSLTGGTAAGTGLTGNATQVSYGQSTSIGNQALAYAANSANTPIGSPGTTNPALNLASGGTMLGAQGVMSGNATLTNQQQVAGQSLNTMSLAGSNNGNVNQATFGATNQTTGNQLFAQSNGGYALTTGVQSATNAVNVITAR